jgi:4-hydroxybenzoate polyprenyltransferase/phosphoserine phosphatase
MVVALATLHAAHDAGGMISIPDPGSGTQLQDPPVTATTDTAALIVDLDGCLLRTDLLWEGLVDLAARRPARLMGALPALFRGRAALKCYVAHQATLKIETLPLEPAVVQLIRDAQANERAVALISGAYCGQVQALGSRVGATSAYGSDGLSNLTGKAKLAKICSMFPRFDYVGNALADLSLWRGARHAYAANPGPITRWRARRARPDLIVLPRSRAAWRAWLVAMRPYQWVKNTLLFLPALAGHLSWTPGLAATLLAGFVAFGLAASAIYVLNDIVDLPHDRRHPTKRRRPFAAGQLSIATGFASAVALLGTAAGIAMQLPSGFFTVLCCYVALTTAYSVALKHKPVLDVITLAMLYTLRVIAGAELAAVVLSRWFLGFSVFFFLSLALVKRVVELQGKFAAEGRDLPGRDYRTSDLPVLVGLGAAATVASAVIYCLYITGDDVLRNYSHPERLWGGLPLLLYWQARVWLFAGRQSMTEDPVVFALRDRVSRLAFVAFLLVVLLAV